MGTVKVVFTNKDYRKALKRRKIGGLMPITYFDSAQAYAGSEGYYGAYWSKNQELRKGVFQASKSASRDKKSALADLDYTLKTMGLSHLDLWQIHDIRDKDDLRKIDSPGGALEAFVEAKVAGKTRFIGVTGHHDPAILSRAIQDWPVDSVMMPVNPVEGAMGGFLDTALPLANEKGVAVIAMKVLGASHYIIPQLGITPELLIRYALSQLISMAIIGCSTPLEVQALARVGRDFKPLAQEEQQDLINKIRPYAKKLAFYRGWA